MGYDEYKKSYECNFLWNLILIAGLNNKIDNRTIEWSKDNNIILWTSHKLSKQAWLSLQ